MWPALYQAAALVLLAGVAGVDVTGWAVVCVGALAMSTYLADRAKVHPSLVDPADVATHPGRVRFLKRYRWLAAELMILSASAAVVCAYVLHPLAVLLVPCAYAGVVWYAHPRRGGRKRPKQVLYVKNGVVAASVAALGACVLVAQEGGEVEWWRLAGAGLVVLLHVFADAALCDLDDAPGDARFGIETLPVVHRERATWAVAWGCKLCAGAGVVWLMGLEWGAVVWAGAPLAGVGASMLLAPGMRRDGVELSFLVPVWLGWAALL